MNLDGARSRLVPPLVTLIIAITLLECMVRLGIVREFIFPAPSLIVRVLVQERETLGFAALSTFSCATLGLTLSGVIGIVLAVIFSLFDFLRRAIYPYAIFFQTVPIISIAPILVIWFGFGPFTVVASSFIVSIFPMIASTLLGLQSTDPQLLELFALNSASRKDIFFKLKFPFALPQIFSGLRIAGGLSVVGAIVGEFIAGGGLGSVIDAARTQQRLDLVFAAVLVSSLLGLVFIAIINSVSWFTLWRWHASEKRKDI